MAEDQYEVMLREYEAESDDYWRLVDLGFGSVLSPDSEVEDDA